MYCCLTSWTMWLPNLAKVVVSSFGTLCGIATKLSYIQTHNRFCFFLAYPLCQCSSLKCAYALQCEGLQNNHTSLRLSNFFATLHQINTWYWLFCIEYKNSMMSHYIEEVHAIEWCTTIVQISYIMHLIINQLQRKSSGFWSISKCQKIYPNPYFPSEDHIMTLASMHPNVSSFDRLLRSLSTQKCLENPCSHIVVLAKPKLHSVLSRSCTIEIAGVIGIWKCLLECQDWRPIMFRFTNCNHYSLWHAYFGEASTVKGGNFAEHIFIKWPHNKNKRKHFWRPKWDLTSVEYFHIEYCVMLPYQIIYHSKIGAHLGVLFELGTSTLVPHAQRDSRSSLQDINRTWNSIK